MTYFLYAIMVIVPYALLATIIVLLVRILKKIDK